MEAYKIAKPRWALMLRQSWNFGTTVNCWGQYWSLGGEVWWHLSTKALATCLTDLANKWLKGCGSVQEVVDAVVKKQLLQTLPEDVWIWVSKRKPATSAEVGQLAEDYLPRRLLSSGSRSRRGQMGDRSQDTISMNNWVTLLIYVWCWSDWGL